MRVLGKAPITLEYTLHLYLLLHPLFMHFFIMKLRSPFRLDPDEKNLHWPSEKMKYLCIMAVKLSCPLNTIVLWWSKMFRGFLNWASMMLKNASLSDSYYISNRRCFSSLVLTGSRIFRRKKKNVTVTNIFSHGELSLGEVSYCEKCAHGCNHP